MFFTNELLCKTGGKFAVVWLAAMKKNRLKRKDFEAVDLPEICLELEKLLAPTWKGKMATVEGFSLRLSAQLVYGISVVYNMKVAFLYKDVNKEYQNLHRQKYTFDLNAIQLPNSPNVSAGGEGINLPETADGHIVDTFLTVDPLFGLPLFVDANISPSLLAPHSFHDLPLPEPPSFNENDSGRNMVKDLSTITLKEQAEPFTLQNEPQHIPESIDHEVKTVEELGVLLPEQDLNNDQTANFLAPDALFEQNIATPKASNEKAKTPERPSKKKKQKEGEEKEDETKTTAEKDQGEEMEKEQTVEGSLFQPAMDDQTRNLFEEAHPLLPEPQQPVEPEQAEAQQSKDELVLDPVSVPKSAAKKKKKPKPRKKRQSSTTNATISSTSQLKVDEIVQLTTEEMKSHMTQPIMTYGDSQFATPIHLPSAKELFDVPVHWFPVHKPSKNLHFHKGLNEKDESNFPYLEIYRENCVPINDDQIISDDVINQQQSTVEQPPEVPTAGEPREKEILDESERRLLEEMELGLLDENIPIVDGSALTLNQTTADKDRSDLTNIEQSRMTGNESSMMIQRSVNKSSMIQHSRISNVSHDHKHQSSTVGQSFNDPSFAKSVGLDENLGLESLNLSELLLDQPEMQQLLEPQPTGNYEFDSTTVEREIRMEMDKGNHEMTFSSLLPPSGTSKLAASRGFFDLLMMAKQGKVELHQQHDFSEIYITPTMSYIG